MKIAVFPGSFDPFTKGHESVVVKALEVFDEVIIAIGVNTKKQALFTLEKRTQHIESLFNSKVQVLAFEGLTVDLCKRIGSVHIIRGLRDVKDFEYERSIAQMNHVLYPVETIFFLTEIEHASINSSIVREIFLNGGDISAFVTNPKILV
jgi:pantetheine-phosphate adenylyltransferase